MHVFIVCMYLPILLLSKTNQFYNNVFYKYNFFQSIFSTCVYTVYTYMCTCIYISNVRICVSARMYHVPATSRTYVSVYIHLCILMRRSYPFVYLLVIYWFAQLGPAINLIRGPINLNEDFGLGSTFYGLYTIWQYIINIVHIEIAISVRVNFCENKILSHFSKMEKSSFRYMLWLWKEPFIYWHKI